MKSGTPEQRDEVLKLVREALSAQVSPERIIPGDCRYYMPILLDFNHRKTICRVYFYRSKLYLGTISTRKVETRVPISSAGEIANFAPLFTEVLKKYTGQ